MYSPLMANVVESTQLHTYARTYIESRYKPPKYVLFVTVSDSFKKKPYLVRPQIQLYT